MRTTSSARLASRRRISPAPSQRSSARSSSSRGTAGRGTASAASAFERVLAFAPRNPSLLYNTACAYALAGEGAKALDLLERAVGEGYRDKAGLMADPDLESVRGDPRFAEIVKRLG
jgi:Flp pilus assembly protein TadD